MTVTAQRRQPPVVPLTLTSDLTLQQSPQQLSPTALSSPINITQVRLSCAGRFFPHFNFLTLGSCEVGPFQCYCRGSNQAFTQTFTGDLVRRSCLQSCWRWSSSWLSTLCSTSWRRRPRLSCSATCRSSSRLCPRASSSLHYPLLPRPALPQAAAPPRKARARPLPASASTR